MGVLLDWITLDNPDVTGLQEDYVREVVQTVGGFDNVLCEVCNEAGPQSHDWQEHFVEFVRRCEAGMAEQHPVGVTGCYPGHVIMRAPAPYKRMTGGLSARSLSNGQAPEWRLHGRPGMDP